LNTSLKCCYCARIFSMKMKKITLGASCFELFVLLKCGSLDV
jgi:hypothetical protein